MITISPIKLFLYIALMMLIAAVVFSYIGYKHGVDVGYGVSVCQQKGKDFVAIIGNSVICKNKPEDVVWFMK